MSVYDNLIMDRYGFKEFDKDSFIGKVVPLDWDLEINGRPYYVANMFGHIHTYGGKYHHNDLWCYPRDEEPSYKNLIPYNKNCACEWGLIYNKDKSYRGKHGIDSIDTITITRNGKPFYTLHDVYEALSIINYKVYEHPLNLCDIDYDKKMIGRKIWYRGEPGVITRWVNDQACVVIEPDGIDKFTYPAEYCEDDGQDTEYEERDLIIDIFKCGNIWWFRD